MGEHSYEKLILQKNFFTDISMGVHRNENLYKNLLNSLISGSTQAKTRNCT